MTKMPMKKDEFKSWDQSASIFKAEDANQKFAQLNYLLDRQGKIPADCPGLDLSQTGAGSIICQPDLLLWKCPGMVSTIFSRMGYAYAKDTGAAGNYDVDFFYFFLHMT